MPNQVNLTLHFIPREWQDECIKSRTRYSVWALHRRAGKSTLSAALMSTEAIKKPGNYVFISPQKNQCKTNMWKIFKEQLQDFINYEDENGKPMVVMKESTLEIQFWNGSTIYLAGGDDPDKMRGVKLAGAVIDEVAQTPKELWYDVIMPALLDSKGWAIFIGTPKGINIFSELFYLGQEAQHKEWSSRRYTCYETNALSLEEIEKIKLTIDENTFRREFLCDFDASAEDQLLTLAVVNEAMVRERQKQSYYSNMPLIMGIDVARFGDDSSSIVFRQGQFLETPLNFKGMSIVEFADVASKQINMRQPDQIFVDATGIGGGLVDVLRSRGFFVHEINFSQKSSERQYFNKRTEMWCKMAEWIRKGGLLPNDNELRKDLCAPLYETNEGGVIQLESKKDIKKRLGRSPDVADAISLTFAEDYYNVNSNFVNEQLKVPCGTVSQRYVERIRNVNSHRRNYY